LYRSTFGLVDLGSTLGVVSAFFGIVTFVGAFEVSGEGSFLDVVTDVSFLGVVLEAPLVVIVV
jgi:hypothetical protein